MTERSGPLSVQETYGNGRGDPRPVALPEPVSSGDIMGAHWTVDRQDIVGQTKIERDKYGQIAAEIDAHDGVSALQSIFMPRHGTPDLIGGNTAYDKDAIWRDVQRIRQTNPDFLSSTPARNAAEFDAWLLDRSKRERAAAQSVIGRQSGLAQNALGFGTDLVTGFTDPVNLGTLPIGGGGKTLVATMARDALLNGAIETVELPMVAHHRAELGENMTAVDMAAEVGMAAVGGAAFGGALHGAGKGASAAARAIGDSDAGKAVGRALTPLALRTADLGTVSDGDVAAAFSRAVPAEIRTPEQQAALHVIERQSEIDAANPFVDTPAARDLHADRLEAALAAIQTVGDPDAAPLSLTPRTPVSQNVSRGNAPLVTGDAAVSTVIARIGRVENASGGGDVRNPRSSATGKYQFTDRTWLNYYKRELGAGGMTDAQILAKRADGATQDLLMQSLTQDNARFLHSIGQAETAGNLYLTHFAGPGGARRILEAEAGTPIERVLSAEAIAANPFLRGKTAGDVVDWAHAKMGEPSIGADRVRIVADGGDDAVRLAQQELDSATLEAAVARATGERVDAPIDTAIDAVPHIDVADEVALKPRGAGETARPAGAEAVPRETGSDVPRDGVPASASMLYHGTRGDWADANPNGMGMTFFGENADIAQRYAQGGGGRRMAGEPRVITRDALAPSSILDLTTLDGARVLASLDMPKGRAREWVQAAQRAVNDATTPGADPSGTALWSLSHAVWSGTKVAAGSWADSIRREIVGALEAKGYRGMRFTDDAHPTVAVFDDAARLADDARAAPISTDERIAGFDRPDDAGATTQIDSLEHDARIAVAADPGMTVTLEEGGAGVRLADVLADLDDDAAAIQHARNCL